MPRASREIRKGRAIRRLRWVVLAATIVAVAAVVGLFLAGRAERGPSPDAEEPLAQDDDLDTTDEMVTVGEGFERTLTEEDRPVFTVRGERFAVDREETVHLEGVSVILHPEEGMRYEIEGAEGTFDVDRRSGVLTGGVELTGPDGLRLTTDRLEVTNRGGLVTSGGKVYLRLGDVFHARADRLRVALRARRLFLLGRARVASLPEAEVPFVLTGDRVLLDRTRQMLEAEGRPAKLERSEDRLAAQRLSVFLAEDEETVRYIRAEGGVVADLRSVEAPGSAGGERAGGMEVTSGEPTGAGVESAAGEEQEVRPPNDGVPAEELDRLRLRGGELEIEMTPDGEEPRSFFLVGDSPDGLAVARSLGPAGEPVHTLVAPRIEGRFEDGVPVALEAGEGVELTTRAAAPDPGIPPGDVGAEGTGPAAPAEPPVVRTARGRRARAHFGPEGDLERVELEGAVTLTGEGVDARGERGVFRLEADEGELFGSPALVESARGTMEAPSVLYTREDGLVQGRGGVRARLDSEEGEAGASVLEGSPLGDEEGPLWVEAEQGFFRDTPRAFLFVGSVRAWRGDDLLVANRLLGEESEGRLVASGDVRTVWRPDEEPPEHGGEASAPGDRDGPTADGPLEATADELVYERAERLLVYTGDVVAEQAERVLRCQEMEVHLSREGAPGGGVRELVCTGEALLEDPANGRTLVGHRLVYDPEARLFEAVGAEGGAVTLEDATGNVIEGPRMIYDIDADEVRVLGRQGADGAAEGEPAPDPPASPPAPEGAPARPERTGGTWAP